VKKPVCQTVLRKGLLWCPLEFEAYTAI
jgi:hypothetical protein